MGVAVVGLVGVVLGALVSGIATDFLGRRKRRERARAAARLIALELELARIKLASITADVATSSDAGTHNGENAPSWWGGVPSVRVWQRDFDALGNDAGDKLLTDVAGVYTKLENWIEERQLACDEPEHPPPRPDQMRRLRHDVGEIGTVVESLRTFVENPPGQTQRSASRISALLVSALAAVALVLVVVVSRPNVNTATVASAVEQLQGPDSVADCRDVGDDWSCSVTMLSGTRSQCLRADARVLVASNGAMATGGTCATVGPVKQDTVEDTGAELVVSQSATSRQHAALSELVGRVADPARSLLVRFGRYLLAKTRPPRSFPDQPGRDLGTGTPHQGPLPADSKSGRVQRR